MINVNNWITLSVELDNMKPTPPQYPEYQINSKQVWDTYFYDLEQYHYQIMLNNYKQIPSAVDIKLNIKFKGIG